MRQLPFEASARMYSHSSARRAMRSMWILLVVVLATAVSGCRGKQAGSTGSAGSSSVTAAQITDVEATQFGTEFAKAASEGNGMKVSRMIDVDEIGDAALQGIDIKPASKASFLEGFRGSAAGSGGLGARIVQEAGQGGSFEFLRAHTVDNRKRALIRMINGEGGVNYLDTVIGKDATGHVVASDIYLFVSGELMSQTLRRAALPLAAHENRGLVARLTGSENAFVKNLPTIQEITTAMQAHDSETVLAKIHTLPAELQTDKNILLIRIQAAMKGADAEYTSALEDYRRLFPNDPGIDILSIDYYLLKKEHSKSMEAIDRLDRAVGGDPYLNVLRAALLMEKGDLEKAQEAADAAAKAMPNREDPYDVQLTLSLRRKRFGDTARLLDKLEKEFKVPSKELIGGPLYSEFRESPEGRQWAAAHAQ